MSNAKKFSANGTDIDVQKFLNNIDTNTEAYITQMNWGAKRANAFRTNLSQYKNAISSGDIANRDAGGQYIDTKGNLQNKEEKFKGALGIDWLRKDRDINGDVASFLDTQLNPMVHEKMNTPKAVFNPNFMGYFNNQAFNSDKPDWDAWKARDADNFIGKGKNKVLSTAARTAELGNILKGYKEKIDADNTDYDWGEYGSKQNFLDRLNSAQVGLVNGFGNNDYTTLSKLGITKEMIDTNLFNSKIQAAAKPIAVTPETKPEVAQPAAVTDPNAVPKTAMEQIQDADKKAEEERNIKGFLSFKQLLNSTRGNNFIIHSFTASGNPGFSHLDTTGLAQGLQKYVNEYNNGHTQVARDLAQLAALYFMKPEREPRASLGNNQFIVPYSANKNGTYMIYDKNTGSVSVKRMSDKFRATQSNNETWKWLANYIYNRKDGGVLSRQNGGTLEQLQAQLTKAKQEEEIRQTHPEDLPIGFTYDPNRITNLQHAIQVESQKQQRTQLKKENTASNNDLIAAPITRAYEDSWGKASNLDKLRGIANTLDIGSLGVSFLPGWGNAAGVGLSGIGTIVNTIADANDPNITRRQLWKNLGKNIAFTGAAAIPGFAASKYGKFTKLARESAEQESKIAKATEALGEARKSQKAAEEAFNATKNAEEEAKFMEQFEKSSKDIRDLHATIDEIKPLEDSRDLLKKADFYKKLNLKTSSKLAGAAILGPNVLNSGIKVLDDPNARNLGDFGLSLANAGLWFHGKKGIGFKTVKDPITQMPKNGEILTTRDQPVGGTAPKPGETPKPGNTPGDTPNGSTPVEGGTSTDTKPVGTPETEPTRTPTTEVEIKPKSTYQKVKSFAGKHKVGIGIGIGMGAASFLSKANGATPNRRLVDITYPATGNTDVGSYSIDPTTGNLRIYTPNGQFYKNATVALSNPAYDSDPDLRGSMAVITGNKNKVKKHKQGGVIKGKNGITVGGGPDPKKTWLDFDKIQSSFNKIYPDISATVRTIGDIQTNNTVKNQMLSGMHAPLYNSYQVNHGIYGNEGQKQAYYQRANELEYQPQNITSDASLQLASNLDRKLNADKYRIQGDMENNKAIAGNAELANKYSMQNAQVNNEMANRNMQSMNTTNQARMQLAAQTTSANRQSIDTYLEQMENKRQAQNAKIQDLQGNNMQNWLQFQFYNNAAEQSYQQQLTNWLLDPKNKNLDITNSDLYKNYQNYQLKQNAGYQNAMNDYLRQVYPGYNPKIFNAK